MGVRERESVVVAGCLPMAAWAAYGRNGTSVGESRNPWITGSGHPPPDLWSVRTRDRM